LKGDGYSAWTCVQSPENYLFDISRKSSRIENGKPGIPVESVYTNFIISENDKTPKNMSTSRATAFVRTPYNSFNSSQQNKTDASPYAMDDSDSESEWSEVDCEAEYAKELRRKEMEEREMELKFAEEQEESMRLALRDFIQKTYDEMPANLRPRTFPEQETLNGLQKEALYAWSQMLLQVSKPKEESFVDSEDEECEAWMERRDRRLEERDADARRIYLENHSEDEEDFPNSEIFETSHSTQDGRRIYVLVVGHYKKVANRVKPVPATFPEKFKTVRKIPSDPLLGLPELPKKPGDFVPTEKFTLARKNKMKVNNDGLLWPEEEKLAIEVIRLHEGVFAWDVSERGSFRKDYFEPVVIPVIEHTPWAEKNFPIPPGLFEEIVEIVKEKVAAGVYEPSNSSYRSKWFPVTKKDERSLRVVHDLQPLNAVTIRDTGQIPFTDSHTELMGARGVYSSFDLFVAYDQRELAEESRDLTTFQTPLGTFRLTGLPMGYTNAVPILQGDMTFILQQEIPDPANPFMDDCAIVGPRSRYEVDENGIYLPSPAGFIPPGVKAANYVKGADNIHYETIPENPGIRRFIWEHLNDVSRCLQRVKKSGGTFSGAKSEIAVPEIISVGRRLTYAGRYPELTKVEKVLTWPTPTTVTQVRGFLGICGVCRLWIKDYSKKGRALVKLTRKDVPFEWGEEQEEAMRVLKESVKNAPCLRPIDYRSDLPVVLAVDSSVIGVGWLLLQLGTDRRRYPARFGSINWNERESRYSQPKLEIYGLWRALRANRLHIIGARNLIVEVDASYISGMLKNPDMQPNATVNRWIVGIKLFDFELVHVPAERHSAADGMSRREPVEGDEDEGGTPEEADDWIDSLMSFAMETLNLRPISDQQIPFFCEGPEVNIQVPRTGDWSSNVVAAYMSSEDIGSPVPEGEYCPMTEATLHKNARITEIRNFLEHPELLTMSSRKDLFKIQEAASRFWVAKGKLLKFTKTGKALIVPHEHQRVEILRQTHDTLGHKGAWTMMRNLRDRFWWPSLQEDAVWFASTCKVCQSRQHTKILIPPTVAEVPTLFSKCHMDSMVMPKANQFRYIVQGRCALTSYPEWRALRRETGDTVGNFIFEEILCRWGAVRTIVTDNGGPFVAALDYLGKRYGIHHIQISPYNKQANGLVEAKHYSVRESIMRVADNDPKHWPQVAHVVFWAERCTIRRTVGYSPYYMVHGVEPLMPLDIAEATYLAPQVESPMSTTELISMRARQLLKRPEDLELMRERIWKYRLMNRAAFIRHNENIIKDYDFTAGTLVLVRNSRIEMELDRKAKPRYLGPLVVVRRNRGGAYILAELDGSIWKSPVAAFRVIPYNERSSKKIHLAKLLGEELLEQIKPVLEDVELSHEDVLDKVFSDFDLLAGADLEVLNEDTPEDLGIEAEGEYGEWEASARDST